MLLDLQDGTAAYFDKMGGKKAFYVVFDTVWSRCCRES